MKRARARRILPPDADLDVSAARRPAKAPATGSDPAVIDNVQTVSHVEHRELHRRSLAERLADVIAAAAGSTPSLVFHAVFLGSWLWLNTVGMPGVRAFDPFPFGLLTTILSLEAIFLSLFILISQGRMSRQAERREHLDLQINLLAEQESTATLKLLRRLCEHEGVDLAAFDAEAGQLEKKTNVQDLVAQIDHKLPAGQSARPGG